MSINDSEILILTVLTFDLILIEMGIHNLKPTGKSTVTKNGSWTILLDPMNVGGPYTMIAQTDPNKVKKSL